MLITEQPSGRRQWLMFVGLVGTVGITVILLAEILLRVIGFHDPFFYRYNQYAGVGLNPGARGWYTREGRAEVQINSHENF